MVKTGLQIAIPPGTYARVAPRSGLAVKHFIDTGAGVVDEDYRGEVGVVLFNHADTPFPGACAMDLVHLRCAWRGAAVARQAGGVKGRLAGWQASTCFGGWWPEVAAGGPARQTNTPTRPHPPDPGPSAAPATAPATLCHAVKRGDRVAQLILERIATPEVVEVESLDDTQRGAGGYGSTGVAS